MTKGKHLNELDKKVLQFIIKYKVEHCGDSPTLREIGHEVGITSTSHITFIIEKLEDFGLISITHEHKGRMSGIAVTGMVVVLCDSSHATADSYLGSLAAIIQEYEDWHGDLEKTAQEMYQIARRAVFAGKLPTVPVGLLKPEFCKVAGDWKS